MYPKLIEFPPIEIPDIFGLGPITISFIPTYGFILAIGFLLSLKLAVKLSQRDGFAPGRIVDLSIYTLLTAVLSAKILLIFYDLGRYWRNPGEILSIVRLAGVFYGGFIGAFIFILLYVHWHRMRITYLLDNFAPAVILGQAIGRWGCLCAGCCYGIPTSLPWGLVYTDPYCHATTGVPLGTPLHPTQIYESAGNFVILIVLLFIWKRRKFPGEVFASYVILYPVTRFFWEFLRGDAGEKVLYDLMTKSQVISLLLVAAGAAFYIYLKNRRLPDVKSEEESA